MAGGGDLELPIPEPSIAAGGCLCGAVRYELTSEPEKVFYCHCRMCQRAAGAPVVAWAAVLRSTLVWTLEVPRVYRSSARAERLFCATCGTPLVFLPDDDPARLDLAVATLDDPRSMRPSYHWSIETAQPWLDMGDRLPRHVSETAD